jgi:hypothetical protein
MERLDMKNFVIYSAVLLLLAVNCLAVSPLPLEGAVGRAILDNMTDRMLNQSDVVNQTENQTGKGNLTQNQTENQTGGDLWSWGSLPAGYTLDETGKLTRIPTGEVEWLPGL